MEFLIVTKSIYVLGHGRFCASGILTGHCEGNWAICMIRVKLRLSIPTAVSTEPVLQNVGLSLEGPLPRVACEHGSDELQASAKRSSVFTLLECFSPLCSTPLNLEKREWPLNAVAPAAKDRYHASEEETRGLPAKLGPGEQLFPQMSAPLSGRLTVHSCTPAMRVKVSEVATQSSRDGGPAVQLPGASQGSLSRS